MKILFILSDMNGGGSQRVVSLLANKMSKKNNDITICTINQTEDNFKIYNKVNRIKFDLKSPSFFFHKVSNNLKKIFLVRKLIRENRNTIIISFIHKTNLLVLLSSIFLKRKIIVCERNDMKKQELGFFYNILRFYLYRFAKAVFVNLESNIEEMKYVNKKNIFYLPNPVKIQKKLNYKRTKTILSIGRLHSQKNYIQLIKFFKKFSKIYPEWKYLIIGKGELNNKLLKLIKDLRLEDKVSLKGFTNPKKYLNSSSFLLFGSIYEGMPNAILEAMSFQLPVLSSNFNGVENLIKNNKTGFVYDIKSEKDLLKKMIIMASKNHSSIALEAYKKIQDFDIDNVTEKWNKTIIKINQNN